MTIGGNSGGLHSFAAYGKSSPMLTPNQVIQKLKSEVKEKSCAVVSRSTGLPYRYVRNLIQDEIKNPGSAQIDLLRAYYAEKDRA